MIVQGVVVHCSTGCGRDATCFVRCGGGGLYYCDSHAPLPLRLLAEAAKETARAR